MFCCDFVRGQVWYFVDMKVRALVCIQYKCPKRWDYFRVSIMVQRYVKCVCNGPTYVLHPPSQNRSKTYATLRTMHQWFVTRTSKVFKLFLFRCWSLFTTHYDGMLMPPPLSASWRSCMCHRCIVAFLYFLLQFAVPNANAGTASIADCCQLIIDPIIIIYISILPSQLADDAVTAGGLFPFQIFSLQFAIVRW